MSVDLNDLIPSLVAEVNPPGSDLFAAATDDEWLQILLNAFWSARLDGFIELWTVDDNGTVTPIATGGTDISRDLQQIVVLYGSFLTLRNALRASTTSFTAKAGNVEFQTQQSANLLTELLKDVVNRRNILLTRLSDLGVVKPYYIDAVIARSSSIYDRLTYFTD